MHLLCGVQWTFVFTQSMHRCNCLRWPIVLEIIVYFQQKLWFAVRGQYLHVASLRNFLKSLSSFVLFPEVIVVELFYPWFHFDHQWGFLFSTVFFEAFYKRWPLHSVARSALDCESWNVRYVGAVGGWVLVETSSLPISIKLLVISLYPQLSNKPKSSFEASPATGHFITFDA